MVVSGTDSRNVETLSAPVGGSGGRLPSLLGREFFRTRVTSYHAGTFEDAVIFVHDVASGLAQLGGFENKLIASHSRTTRKVKQRVCWAAGGVRWGRRFLEALDRLTEIFLEAGRLIRLPANDVARASNGQEGRIGEFPASGSAQRG